MSRATKNVGGDKKEMETEQENIEDSFKDGNELGDTDSRKNV